MQSRSYSCRSLMEALFLANDGTVRPSGGKSQTGNLCHLQTAKKYADRLDGSGNW